MEIFMAESGVAGEGDKYDRMRRDALRVREIIEPAINIKGACCFYDELELAASGVHDGQLLKVCGHEIRCTAFEQIDPSSVEGVYFYAVTAGDFSLPMHPDGRPDQSHPDGRPDQPPIMDQLYADIWGTAFTDAAREMLMDELRKADRGCLAADRLSDSFGPGFYGMDTGEMQKMPELVDFESIGMKVTESSMLLPLKSCAGILFKVNEKYTPLDGACELCLGNKRTCSLCRAQHG